MEIASSYPSASMVSRTFAFFGSSGSSTTAPENAGSVLGKLL